MTETLPGRWGHVRFRELAQSNLALYNLPSHLTCLCDILIAYRAVARVNAEDSRGARLKSEAYVTAR